MVRAWFIPSLAVLAALLFPVANGAAETPDPNLWVTNGPVFAMAQHEGTLYLGGQFSEVGPATGGGVIFDPATGYTVPGFPKVVGHVYAATGDGSGGCYIGGLFTSVGGQPRANLAHITSNLTVSAWNPGTNDAVLALALGVGGMVFAGGSFTTAGGQVRPRLAQIDASGFVTAWNPNPSSVVRALAIADGFVYAGGDFNFMGGLPRAGLAQIDWSTGAVGAWNPNCNGTVHAIEIVFQPTTVSILVGGAFTTIAGQARSNLAEITTAGTATPWDPNPNGAVYDLQVHNDVYVGGAFTFIGGFPRNRIAAVSRTTGFATAWNPDADDVVNALAWSMSQVVIGGKFKHVGGQGRNHLARIDENSGVPTDFSPGPNDEVKAIAIGAGGVPASIFAGGEFSALAGVERQNLAAIDIATGTVKAWSPDPNGAVHALQLGTYGTEVYSVYVGGDFTMISGQPRSRLAELDPFGGGARPMDVQPDNTVHAIAVTDSVLYVGGAFWNVDGQSQAHVAAIDARTKQLMDWDVYTDDTVFSLVKSGRNLWIGGRFQTVRSIPCPYIAKFNLPAFEVDGFQNPNNTVRAIAVSPAAPSTVVLAGDFDWPHAHIAAFSENGSVLSYDPSANGIVRCLVVRGSEILAGGDFTTFGGQPRSRLASFDVTSGALSPLSAAVADREVWTLATLGPMTFLGGTFRGVGDQPQAQFAKLGTVQLPPCPNNGTLTLADQGPRAITTGDFDNDGIRDLVVCNVTELARAGIYLGSGSGGLGDGSFTLLQTFYPLQGRPSKAVVADFDADGFDDVAIAQSNEVSGVAIYRNQGGASFASPTFRELWGRVDGLAVADMNQDGILDLVACLLDSARVIGRGGLEILYGTGTAGVWDGSFAPGARASLNDYARQVVLQDFNLDGTLDECMMPGPLMIWKAPGNVTVCFNSGGLSQATSGFALATGDFNGDGLPDVARAGGRFIGLRIKNASLDPNCAGSPWFVSSGTTFLPSTPRDLAVLDFDQDGNLDVVYTLDSLATVEMLPGLGNGTFGPRQQIAAMDAWGIAVGDFVGDGRPDVIVSGPTCGAVTVLTYPGAPLLGGGLQLVTPNGGEVWPAVFPSLPGDAAFAPSTPDAEGPVLAHEGNAPGAAIQSTQQVSWTKEPGVQGVDVFISRNGGASWQPIATNVPGTSMPWIVTPPASNDARIRVSDAAVAWRRDASDAPFGITAGVTGVDSGLPTVVAFAVQGANPTRGRMRFRLDLPSAGEVDVQALDVRGRIVCTLARGRMPAGRHELVWHAQDDRGVAARSGIYFLRARAGSFSQVRKVVLVH